VTEADVLVLNAEAMQPGDVVVLQTSQPISAEQAEVLKQRLCDRMPWIQPGDVVVLAGASLSIVRPPST
jgi:translation initiation factor IF-1